MVNNFLIKRFYGSRKNKDSFFQKNLEYNFNILTKLKNNDPFAKNYKDSLSSVADSIDYVTDAALISLFFLFLATYFNIFNVSFIFILANYGFTFLSVSIFEIHIRYIKVVMVFTRRGVEVGFAFAVTECLRSGDSYVSPKRVEYVNRLVRRLERESKLLL